MKFANRIARAPDNDHFTSYRAARQALLELKGQIDITFLQLLYITLYDHVQI